MASTKVFQLSAEALGTEFVTIHVGPKRKTFAVHKKLICDRSDFFSKAFNSGFRESTEGVMYLPDDNAGAFDSMIVYIYQDQLPAFPTPIYPETNHGVVAFTLGVLHGLFALAEKFCINDLANRVMDRLQDLQLKYLRLSGMSEVRVVYEMTTPKSKLRRYCVLMRLYGDYEEEHPGFGADDSLLTDEDIAYKEEFAGLVRDHPDFLLWIIFHFSGGSEPGSLRIVYQMRRSVTTKKDLADASFIRMAKARNVI